MVEPVHFVVVSGWTGGGKSTLANTLADQLQATVISFDWIMSGLRAFPSVWDVVENPPEHQRRVGWTLMGRVAEQQLQRQSSVVMDLVARDEILETWSDLAKRYDAKFTVIECTCSDIEIHRSRIEQRVRNIPDWYELTWDRVLRGRDLYLRLTGPKLELDTISPFDQTIALAKRYVIRPL